VRGAREPVATEAQASAFIIEDVAVRPDMLRAIAAAVDHSATDRLPDDPSAICEMLRRAGLEARFETDAEVAPRPDDVQAQVLLDAINEGVCLGDARGRVLWSNAFFRALDPATRRLISERLRDASERFAAEDKPDAQKSARFELETEDRERTLEIYVTPAPPRPIEGGDLGEGESQRARADERADREGRERVSGIVRDVTRARENAAKLRAIDRAGYELVRLDTSAVRERNSYERLQLLEDKIVRLFHDVLNYDHFAIFLIDERRQKLELVMSAGLPLEIQDLELTAETEGSGISGYVAATGETYVCRDASTDRRFLPGLVGAQSSLTVPLRIHDRVIGILDIESKQPDAFDESSQQFVEIFARYLALALHMLDLLVVERSTTNQNVSGRVLGELDAPLNDIAEQIAGLEAREGLAPEACEQVRRIREDVHAIRARVADVAAGPQTLVGVDRAMASCDVDPLLSGRRVLVADDEPKIRKVIAAVLRARGCEVEVCPSGGAACEAIERVSRGEAAPFDLVISDIRMPDRNGYEVFATARKVMPNTKVTLMTGFGYDPHHSVVRASQQGLEGVLFKPFDIQQLLDQIHSALSKSEA